MKTTKEFVIKQKEEEEKINKKQNQCFICNNHIDPEKKKKPRWQWNMDSGSFLCIDCFEKKELSYEKRQNFCSISIKKWDLYVIILNPNGI
jgi:hypothetical protein